MVMVLCILMFLLVTATINGNGEGNVKFTNWPNSIIINRCRVMNFKLFKMYTLVQFSSDDSYYVCSAKNIRSENFVTTVKYKNGCSYLGKIICSTSCRTTLMGLKRSLEDGTPFVVLEKLPLENNNMSCKVSHNSQNEDKIALDNENSVDSAVNTQCDEQHLLTVSDNSQNEDKIVLDEENSVDSAVNTQCDEQHLVTVSDNSQNEEIVLDNENSVDSAVNTQCDEQHLLTVSDNSQNEDKIVLDEENSVDSAVNTQCDEQHLVTVSDNSQNEEIVLDKENSVDSAVNTQCDEHHLVLDHDDSNVLVFDFPEFDRLNNNDRTSFGDEDIASGEVSSQLERLNNCSTTLNTMNGSIINCDREGASCEVQSSYNEKCKRAFCMFCKKLITKLPRHLEQIHANEDMVKKLLNLRKGCSERQEILNHIRRRGNYEFNQNFSYNKGKLIVCRRPKDDRKRNDYEYCMNCKVLFSKNTLHRHYRTCTNTQKGQRNVLVTGKTVHAKLHHIASDILKEKIFPVMREDEVVEMIRYDELLIIYGNHLCVKYRSQHNYNMIRARLRLLGRFLIKIKMIDNSILDYQSLFSPKYYDSMISAVNSVARLNSESTKYEAPTSAFQIGTLLKQTGNILIAECIKKGDKEKKKQVEDFLKLLEVDFGTSVNKTVIENQLEMKRRKSSQLPSMSDIRKLCTYLTNLRRRYFKLLHNSFSFEIWKSLSQVTLTSIQVFNRRRAGEIERIRIIDFENYQTINENTDLDIYNSLSENMKKKAKSYVRFTIRGKLARGVPVLLHKELVECIKLIIRYRQAAGVSSENPYIFGLPETRKGHHAHLSACCLMRKYSSSCGASNPHLLRGTELRKHIATQSVLLNLEENEVSDLANFMGHADKIHRDHYRMPVVSREITLMSSLLEKAQGDLEEKEDKEGENRGIDEYSSVCPTDALPKKRKTRSRSPMGFVKRTSWSSPEKNIVEQLFKDNIENEILPSLRYCAEIIGSREELSNRTANQLYAWINNQIKNKQNLKKCSPPQQQPKKKRVVIPWVTPEKQILRKEFAENMVKKRLPSLHRCAEVIMKYKELEKRTPVHIKAWVNNQIKKKL